MATLSEREARKIADTLLKAAMAPEVVVTISDRRAGNTRFARNQPTTQGDVEERVISVTASVQGRSATVTGNRSDKASLEALMAEAEELAALSPVDPEHMAPVDQSLYLKVDGHDKATAKLGAAQRAERVEQAVKVASDAGVEAAGFMQHEERSFAVANSAGTFAYWPSTTASLSVTCRSDQQGSGRGAAVSFRAKDVEGDAVAQIAAEKADMSGKPKALEPGKRTVILEAQAVADLLSFLVRSLDARAADEGRSFFSHLDGGTRLGEELFHTSVRLHSNPADRDNPARPFAADGQPQRIVEWIGDGVLRSLVCSRYWADQSKHEATPRPNSVHLDGQDVDLLELVRAVDEAVLVTRLWYNRMLEPRKIVATGLTRDGTFLVEQGKITTAVKNFRYNDSPVNMLSNVLALGRPERVLTRSGEVYVVPPMVVRDFNFSSLSDAV